MNTGILSNNTPALRAVPTLQGKPSSFSNNDARPPVNAKPSLSTEDAGKHIARGGWNHRDRNGDGRIELSFTIDAGFSAGQQARIRQALQAWQDVTNIRFKENSTQVDGTINFIKDSTLAGGVAQFPSYYSGDVWAKIGTKNVSDSPGRGNHFMTTVIHEIGHAIGLQHPGDYDSLEGGYEGNARYAQDTKARTVMSYWRETHQPGHDFNGRSSAGPLLDDIASVQGKYGRNRDTRNTDTTYGFNSNTQREDLSLTSSSDAPLFCVWDGGGNDTLDFSGFKQRQVINLNPETFSDVGGLKGNVSIASGVVVENAIGGAGDDDLTGNDTHNRIKGGGGADMLRGGGGSDVFVFDSLSDSTLLRPDEILDFESGTDKIDVSGVLKAARVSNVKVVELFTGSAGEVVLGYDHRTGQASLSLDLTGNAKADVFIKAKGLIQPADLVTGKSLDPVVPRPDPTPGNSDTVYGFNSNTGNPAVSLSPFSRSPRFTIQDPGGNDTLDFSGFKQNQRIDLRAGAASSVGDLFNNVVIAKGVVIENAVGGSGNDLVIGNLADNVLKGGAGADIFWGVGGANTYAYGKASDSTSLQADLIMDFVSGRDKIDLSAIKREANGQLQLVGSYTGRIGDTVLKFNRQTGRYFVGVDLTGNRQTDFLVKSHHLIKPEDVIGLVS
ncbi:M10 family metallopeptidase C-terminal domain-containing protein [Pseudomonas lurida]|jgi:serralysin|uniref:M10 family metallopeptidase C-terminal domain-containing protein n=1 Tax=Pseudomonas lurida TaxID=244566 RepID=UPI0009BE4939|nr:M10 family metallopeptidase C-terminal domain-containing protein [Pseudomonas lurida]MBD8671118.1 M10 family metallopeptidase [Pseudomonas lurida]UZQ75713.1 M10 family metallopeptidase C-terminal domain-containing protein [Pseudomonas lurida]WLG30354.1 M10 family metallopeptidase C-terminal domain-containing protein [Pseudomonas lurida]